jgi:hypothetical protein
MDQTFNDSFERFLQINKEMNFFSNKYFLLGIGTTKINYQKILS